ncbi:EAL domain-containing protein [Aliidiomarina iranensis]|nr:EAL domain-containing protein [Aliidiomarina iranensis]
MDNKIMPESAKVLNMPIAKRHLSAELLQEQFSVAYQPRQLTSSRRIVGLEIFARWEHPKYGFIPPADFIHIAEQRDIIDQLTLQILHQALPEFKRLLKQRPELSLSVNISPLSFQHPNFLTSLINICNDYQVAPSQIILDFSESVISDDIDGFIGLIKTFRVAGFKIALDDFGTGNVTATVVERLHLHELKVDISVTQQLTLSKESEFLAKAALRLARQTGALTTAEGVETEETLELVSELGFDIIQGYQISKPMFIDELNAWLREQN